MRSSTIRSIAVLVTARLRLATLSKIVIPNLILYFDVIYIVSHYTSSLTVKSYRVDCMTVNSLL